MKPISVAIATYNRAHIIRETIGYILSQTYAPSEIVVLDDGSSDDTEQVVRSIEGPISYTRIENVGPGAALKAAIESCSHEWIALCDDDDKWMPDHLLRRMQLLSRFPNADFTFSNFTSFGDAALEGFQQFDTIPKGWWHDCPIPDEDGFQLIGSNQFKRFLEFNPVFPTSVVLSRQLYDRAGGIDAVFSRFGCWDAHFTWRCTLHGVSACDHAITVETRRHGANFSRKRSHVNLERAAMLETAWHDRWIPEIYEEHVRQAIAHARLLAARWAWNEHDYPCLCEALDVMGQDSVPRDLRFKLAIARLPATLINSVRRSPSR